MLKRVLAAILLTAAILSVLLITVITANADGTETAQYSVRHHIASPEGDYSYVFYEETFECPLGEKTTAKALTVPGCTVRPFAQKYTMSDRKVQVNIYYDVADSLEAGDVNADGTVNIVDLAILERYLAGWRRYGFESLNLYYADTNGDRELDEADAQNIRKHLVLEEMEKPASDDPWSPWV